MALVLHAPAALLPDGWAADVRLDLDTEGMVEALAAEVPAPPDAVRLPGPVVPGMANLHSHAFQRALAGAAERRGPRGDSFWTWREAMYALVGVLGPDDVEAIAHHLYVELLERGFVAVGEFHYLHHDVDGGAYADPTELSARVIGAARDAGLAITHLPVLYAHSDFGGAPPAPEQRRFVNDPERYARLVEALATSVATQPDVRVGVAPHSLRAVTADELAAAVAVADACAPDTPVHVHVAEQAREVHACLAWSGRRPVEWLLEHAPLDPRWCLVHATHVTADELARSAAAGVTVGLCPSTEANLGDGVFPAVELLAQGGRFGIGTDSHVGVDAAGELCLLEYGQRLVHRRRAMLATPDVPSVGRCLWSRAARAGARALGIASGEIAPGRRADLVVLDADAPALAGADGDGLLDAWIFAAGERPILEVWVRGQRVVADGRHPDGPRAAEAYRRTVAALRARL